MGHEAHGPAQEPAATEVVDARGLRRRRCRIRNAGGSVSSRSRDRCPALALRTARQHGKSNPARDVLPLSRPRGPAWAEGEVSDGLASRRRLGPHGRSHRVGAACRASRRDRRGGGERCGAVPYSAAATVTTSSLPRGWRDIGGRRREHGDPLPLEESECCPAQAPRRAPPSRPSAATGAGGGPQLSRRRSRPLLGRDDEAVVGKDPAPLNRPGAH